MQIRFQLTITPHVVARRRMALIMLWLYARHNIQINNYLLLFLTRPILFNVYWCTLYAHTHTHIVCTQHLSIEMHLLFVNEWMLWNGQTIIVHHIERSPRSVSMIFFPSLHFESYMTQMLSMYTYILQHFPRLTSVYVFPFNMRACISSALCVVYSVHHLHARRNKP